MAVKLIQTLHGHNDRVWTLAWNPAGTVLASSGADKTIRLWALDNSKHYVCTAILTESHTKSIRRICWSPCGNYIASASFDATVCIWKKNPSTGSWTNLTNLEGHESEVKSVAWSFDGNYLASCGRDRTIWIWERANKSDGDDDDDDSDDASGWDCSDVKNDHTKDVKHIVWHPKDNILVSCSYDDTVKLFIKDGDDWSCFETLTAHTSTVWSADFSASGQYLVTCSDDKTVRVWKNHAHDLLPKVESNSWKCVSTIQGYHNRSIYDVSWCRTGDYIASGSGDNALVIYARQSQGDSQNGDIFSCTERISEAHNCDLNSVVWNPKESYVLATGGDDRLIKLWSHTPEEKGKQPMTVVDELLRDLSEASLKRSTDHDVHPKSNESSESILTLAIADFSNLLNTIKTLQKLQNEVHIDTEKLSTRKLLDPETVIHDTLPPITISNLKFQDDENHVKEFCLDIINQDTCVEKQFRLVIQPDGFRLRLPRRSVRFQLVMDELFLQDKTGDLFKILPSGESRFLLGHLFMFSDVQFIISKDDKKIKYILSADRDEKIRISNYPDTYNIERYCFGHKDSIKRIVVINDRKFLSIDQKEEEVLIWNLDRLRAATALFVPEQSIPLTTGNTAKRLCVR